MVNSPPDCSRAEAAVVVVPHKYRGSCWACSHVKDGADTGATMPGNGERDMCASRGINGQ